MTRLTDDELDEMLYLRNTALGADHNPLVRPCLAHATGQATYPHEECTDCQHARDVARAELMGVVLERLPRLVEEIEEIRAART